MIRRLAALAVFASSSTALAQPTSFSLPTLDQRLTASAELEGVRVAAGELGDDAAAVFTTALSLSGRLGDRGIGAVTVPLAHARHDGNPTALGNLGLELRHVRDLRAGGRAGFGVAVTLPTSTDSDIFEAAVMARPDRFSQFLPNGIVGKLHADALFDRGARFARLHGAVEVGVARFDGSDGATEAAPLALGRAGAALGVRPTPRLALLAEAQVFAVSGGDDAGGSLPLFATARAGARYAAPAAAIGAHLYAPIGAGTEGLTAGAGVDVAIPF